MSETIKSVVSEAKNYKKLGDIVVSSRTGGISFKYLLGEVTANTKFGPFLRVYLEYDSLNGEDRYGLGSGWSLSIPYKDVENSSMTFEDGSCRQVIQNSSNGKLEIQYLKQEDVKLYEDGLGVAYLDGRHDIFDEHFGNLIKMKSQSGHCIDLDYKGTVPKVITGHKTSYINFTQFPSGLKVKACMADGGSFSTTIYLSSSNGKVRKILPSTKDTDPIAFEYYADEQAPLSRITMSAGGIHKFEYVELELPGPESLTMPAVSKHTQIADADSVITTTFKYGGDTNQHNYLGNQSGVVWQKGKDSLIESSASYMYEVWVIDYDRQTQHQYNKFHQLVSSTVYSIDAESYALRRTEYEYPNKASDMFIDLPANYQHPIKTTTFFSSDGSSWGRKTVETQKHDSYGNLIESVDVMGRKSVYEYCTPKNRKQHSEFTKIPDGSLFSIMLSERHYDVSGEHYNESTYTHKVCDGVGDMKSFMILTSMVSSSYDGIVLKKKTNEFYPKDDASVFYGYVSSFKVEAGNAHASYGQSYELLNNEASLRVKTEMLASDSNESLDYVKSDFSMQYSGMLPLRREGKDGVIEEMKYDSDQRLIESTTTKGTSSTTIRFLYSRKSGSNHVDRVFASGIITSDADPEMTYTERTKHDGLGRVCSESRQLNPGGELVDMTTYKYGLNGMLASKLEWISCEDGSDTSLKTLFEYDGLRRVTKKTNPLSVVTEWAYDDAENTVTVSHKAADGEKLGPTFKRADNAGNTIEINVYKPDDFDEPYSKTRIDYDGFGRESERTINEQLRIKHEYDDPLFKEKVIHEGIKGKPQEYRETIIIHDPMNMEPASISMVRNQGSSPTPLGNRTFDAFGRLTEEYDPEHAKESFTYSNGLLVVSKDPLGTTTQRTYQTGLLTKVEYQPEKTVPDLPDLKRESTNYLYDKNNMLKEVHLVREALYSEEYKYHHDRSMASKTVAFGTTV